MQCGNKDKKLPARRRRYDVLNILSPDRFMVLVQSSTAQSEANSHTSSKKGQGDDFGGRNE